MAKFILALCVLFFAVPSFAQETASVAGSARTYTVKPGNSLSRIARRLYGSASSWPAIAAENRIAGPKYIIYPGQILNIPALPAAVPALPATIKPAPSHASVSTTEHFSLLRVPDSARDSAGNVDSTLLNSQPVPETLSAPTLETIKAQIAAAQREAKPGQKIRIRAMLTAYDACPLCTEKNPDDPKYGITAIGRNALVADGVAVDPRLIPYRVYVEIPGVGRRVVDDTGVGMRRQALQGVLQIDVRKESHAEALKFGVQYRDIYIDAPSGPLIRLGN